jgi:hypothetical protein
LRADETQARAMLATAIDAMPLDNKFVSNKTDV